MGDAALRAAYGAAVGDTLATLWLERRVPAAVLDKLRARWLRKLRDAGAEPPLFAHLGRATSPGRKRPRGEADAPEPLAPLCPGLPDAPEEVTLRELCDPAKAVEAVPAPRRISDSGVDAMLSGEAYFGPDGPLIARLVNAHVAAPRSPLPERKVAVLAQSEAFPVAWTDAVASEQATAPAQRQPAIPQVATELVAFAESGSDDEDGCAGESSNSDSDYEESVRDMRRQERKRRRAEERADNRMRALDVESDAEVLKTLSPQGVRSRLADTHGENVIAGHVVKSSKPTEDTWHLTMRTVVFRAEGSERLMPEIKCKLRWS